MTTFRNLTSVEETEENYSTSNKEIIGWAAVVLSLIYYNYPLQLVVKIIKGKAKYQTMNIWLLLVNLLNCVIWCSYSTRQSIAQMCVVNGLGAIFTFLWLCVYWVYMCKKQTIQSMICIVFTINIVTETFYIFYRFFDNVNTVGYIVLFVNLLLYYLPGYDLVNVIKTKNRKLIPVHISTVSLCASISWLIFAIKIENIFIIIPNSLGAFLSFLQISIWCWARIYYPNAEEEISKEQNQKEQYEKDCEYIQAKTYNITDISPSRKTTIDSETSSQILKRDLAFQIERGMNKENPREVIELKIFP